MLKMVKRMCARRFCTTKEEEDATTGLKAAREMQQDFFQTVV